MSSFSSRTVTLVLLAIICLACIAILGSIFFFAYLNRLDATQPSVTVTNSEQVEIQAESTTNTNTIPVFTSTTFSVVSSEIEDGGELPLEFTCDGIGEFPQLSVLNVPKKAVSLALIIHDPDVPIDIRSDRTWYHFLAWNIPKATTEITADMSAPVVYGTTTTRTTVYIPPCPPDDEHRYIFTVYALDTTLDLQSNASAIELLDAMKDHVVKYATLTTTYNRHAQTSSSD
ncbi:MAG: YbhB/YbcL family Raf kinase inhibitor-like protein [Candidatus Kerfeldbacteria bacterium]|nr:YbhB/YbcL family Raf kinase inhibitor-like protein [Candidatus Kerfeldbacteria bacterium]